MILVHTRTDVILVHIRTRLDLLGIQTFRWDQRLQLQNFFMALGRQYSNLNRHVSTQEKQTRGNIVPHQAYGVIEMAIQYGNILPHVMPLGNFIQYCSLHVSLFVLDF